MSLILERDNGAWYILDPTGLIRVADCYTTKRHLAEKMKTMLETGELPHGWVYEAPGHGPGLHQGKLYGPPTIRVDVWEPQHTAFK